MLAPIAISPAGEPIAATLLTVFSPIRGSGMRSAEKKKPMIMLRMIGFVRIDLTSARFSTFLKERDGT